jgi:hypothetical protein
MEALACSIDHPSVIKFNAIHVETMEVYQSWWNKSKLWGMLKYHNSQNQSFGNHELL